MKQPIEFKTALLILFSVTILTGGLMIFKFQTPSKNPASVSAVSQVVSSSTPSVSYEYDVSLPDSLIVVDPQGRRTGKDSITGTVYREIPNSNYQEIGQSGELIISDMQSGRYSIYVTGGQDGSYWLDGGTPSLQLQVSRGTIQTGSMIKYEQNFNLTNLASSTFFLSGATSTTSPQSGEAATTTNEKAIVSDVSTSTISVQVGQFTLLANCTTEGGQGSISGLEVLKQNILIQTFLPSGKFNFSPGGPQCPIPEVHDINFDGYPDFMIADDYGTGGTSFYYWLFNTSTQQFYCPGGSYYSCSLMNPSFDPTSKTISAWDELGASDEVSWIYKVSGDNLILYKETDTTTSGSTTTITVKQLENGQMVIVSASTTPASY